MKPNAASSRNPFKDKLRRGEVVVVLNPDHPSPSLAEFVAGLGFDGIFVDCEHGMATIERVQDMCRAARVAAVQSIVRPETGANWLITRYLDAGAGGLMVPHVENAEIAKGIVNAVRYARPQDHQDKVIIAMIESLEALENLPAILAVEGIDIFFIGPNDLSSSMGFPGDIHHPEVKAKVKETIDAIRAAGRVAGTLVVRETAAEYVAAGALYLYEHANNLLATGARDFKLQLAS